MNPDLASLLWPPSRLGDVLQALAGKTDVRLRTPSALVDEQAALEEWLERAAACLGLESQAVETPYADFERQVSAMGPALIRMSGGFLAVSKSRSRSRVTVLAPDWNKHKVAPATIRSALCNEMEAPVAEQVQQLLERAGVSAAKQPKALEAILRERFSALRIRGIWLLRLPPSANFWVQLRQARVPQRLFTLAGAHAIQYVLWIAAWWVVGANVLRGRTDNGWIALWALLLFTLVPLRVLITWLQGLIAFGAGARLKQRLFFGALRLEPDSIRHQGAGQLLGRVIESEAVDALALSGGFLAVVALIEILISIFVLDAGAGATLQPVLLLGWLAASGVAGWMYYRRNRRWTDVRLAMTHDLVESMVGHRTRLAQLAPDRWHDGEDDALERYLKASKAMDSSTVALTAMVPRGWLVLGLAGLAPSFISGGESAARMAIAVGGMLLAYRALRRLTAGAWQLAGAAVAWQRVSVLYDSATRPEELGAPNIVISDRLEKTIEARELAFSYRQRTEPVLRGCSLEISARDRVVLEGPSGGGKSTLVALLVGLRKPNSGSLLIDGCDRATLGAAGWRKRIAAAPQFHENHVLAETFMFNLFMGRRGALGPADIEEAEVICRELGLGDLLERMPAGMLQMVGETGWQLSHGERSRLYIARALIQNAELVILDESFAALDPENLQRAVECVVRRARSLLVIAHR
jgi:ABC-type multidrug transport system fused ATPase/permease subunit